MRLTPICILLQFTVLNLVNAQTIEVELIFPQSSYGASTECDVFVVSGSKTLSQVSAPEEGVYVLEHPKTGDPFELIVKPKNYPLRILEQLMKVDNRLELSVSEIARWEPYGKQFASKSMSEVRTQIEDIRRARELLPDQQIQEELTRLETMILEQEPISILIPAYFYPNGKQLKEWEKLFRFVAEIRLQARERKVAPPEILVVLNVFDGSGTKIVEDESNPLVGQPKGFDPNYAKIVKRLDRAKIPWLGYIDANYGEAKPKNPIPEDIEFWISRYQSLAGFFIDRCPSGSDKFETMKSMCRVMKDAFKANGNNVPRIIANPGTICEEDYGGLFESICMFERPFKAGERILRPGWALEPTLRTTLSSLPYGITDKDDLQLALNQSIQSRTKFVFFTDQENDGSAALWTRMPDDELLKIFASAILIWNKRVAEGNGLLPTPQELFKGYFPRRR